MRNQTYFVLALKNFHQNKLINKINNNNNVGI